MAHLRVGSTLLRSYKTAYDLRNSLSIKAYHGVCIHNAVYSSDAYEHGGKTYRI